MPSASTASTAHTNTSDESTVMAESTHRATAQIAQLTSGNNFARFTFATRYPDAVEATIRQSVMGISRHPATLAERSSTICR